MSNCCSSILRQTSSKAGRELSDKYNVESMAVEREMGIGRMLTVIHMCIRRGTGNCKAVLGRGGRETQIQRVGGDVDDEEKRGTHMRVTTKGEEG